STSPVSSGGTRDMPLCHAMYREIRYVSSLRECRPILTLNLQSASPPSAMLYLQRNPVCLTISFALPSKTRMHSRNIHRCVSRSSPRPYHVQHLRQLS